MPSSKSPSKVVTGSGRLPVSSVASSAPSAAFLLDGDYGDLIVSDRGTALHIQNGVVANAKLSVMPEFTVKVQKGSSSIAPVDLHVPENTVLGRTSGDIVAARVQNSQLAGMQIHSVKVNDSDSTSVPPNDLFVPNNRVVGRGASGSVVAMQVNEYQIENGAVSNDKLRFQTGGYIKGRRLADNVVRDLDHYDLSALALAQQLVAPWSFDDMFLRAEGGLGVTSFQTLVGQWHVQETSGSHFGIISNMSDLSGNPGIVQIGCSSNAVISVRDSRRVAFANTWLSEIVLSAGSAPVAVGLLAESPATWALPTAPKAIYVEFSATTCDVVARRLGAEILRIPGPQDLVANRFRHVQFVRLGTHAVEVWLNGSLITTVGQSVHQIQVHDAVRVVSTISTGSGGGDLLIDAVGCSYHANRLV